MRRARAAEPETSQYAPTPRWHVVTEAGRELRPRLALGGRVKLAIRKIAAASSEQPPTGQRKPLAIAVNGRLGLTLATVDEGSRWRGYIARRRPGSDEQVVT